MTDLTDLIARLEAASEGSMAIDCEIAEACGLVPEGMEPMGGFGFTYPVKGGFSSAVQYHPPAFSRSLDAALSLVPEGAVWKVFSDWPGDLYWAFVTTADWLPGDRESEYRSGGRAAPALALCIAALRARSAARRSPPRLAGCSSGRRNRRTDMSAIKPSAEHMERAEDLLRLADAKWSGSIERTTVLATALAEAEARGRAEEREACRKAMRESMFDEDMADVVDAAMGPPLAAKES